MHYFEAAKRLSTATKQGRSVGASGIWGAFRTYRTGRRPRPCQIRAAKGIWLHGWYNLVQSNGGDTVSTEAVATRRHAGRHLPAIGWKNRTANTELALAA